MEYKVCIQAAGIGSRLRIGKGLHKALIPIKKKAILSRIIDIFPKKTSFVILVGYKKNQVISFIKAKHSDINVSFVDVKKFTGKGSGPGYSLLQAKKYLQQPFIFMACDTIVFERPPLPKKNWIGVSKAKSSKDYLIVESNKKLMSGYYEKKSENFIYSKSKQYKKKSNKVFDAFIGLAGINNYENFWNGLSKNRKLYNNELQVSNGFNSILEKNNTINVIDFKWIDTGSDENYSNARNFFKDNFLLKNDEFFYNDRKKVIKLFLDESKAKKRFQRSEYIRSIVPKTYISGSNIIWYYLVKGSLLSNNKDQKTFVNFCNFLQKKIWSKRINNESRIPELNQKTMSFYKHKTYKRVNDYISKNKEADKALYINNRPIDPIHKLLSKVNWTNLSKGHYTYFHGDPQPENVIVTGNNKFTMIDWREDFGDDLEYGDIYYDLGKIYHSLIITQKKIREEKYFVSYEGDFAQYKFEKRRNLIQYLNYFEKFILTKKYDLKKVKIISALIYLNIAALHHHPYSDLLFFHGKLTLSELLKEN